MPLGLMLLSLVAAEVQSGSLEHRPKEKILSRLPDVSPNSMTEKILTVLFVFINSLVAATGYAGIAVLMAIESACIPLPSELIMPFAGYLV